MTKNAAVMTSFTSISGPVLDISSLRRRFGISDIELQSCF